MFIWYIYLMDKIPSKQDIDKAQEVVVALRAQNQGYLGTDDYRFTLRDKSYSDVFRVPELQEKLYFRLIDGTADFYKQFESDDLNQLNPKAVAFLLEREESFFTEFQARNSGGYAASVTNDITAFAKELNHAIQQSNYILTTRRLLEDYVDARHEYRKAENVGRVGDAEPSLAHGKRVDFERAATWFMESFSFETKKGEFLELETARIREEAKLLESFKLSYLKAERKGALGEFLEALGMSENINSSADSHYKELANQNGGVEFIMPNPVIAEHMQKGLARGIHYFGQTVQTFPKDEPSFVLREGGYKAALDNTAALTDRVTRAQEVADELSVKKLQSSTPSTDISAPGNASLLSQILGLVGFGRA